MDDGRYNRAAAGIRTAVEWLGRLAFTAAILPVALYAAVFAGLAFQAENDSSDCNRAGTVLAGICFAAVALATLAPAVPLLKLLPRRTPVKRWLVVSLLTWIVGAVAGLWLLATADCVSFE